MLSSLYSIDQCITKVSKEEKQSYETLLNIFDIDEHFFSFIILAFVINVVKNSLKKAIGRGKNGGIFLSVPRLY